MKKFLSDSPFRPKPAGDFHEVDEGFSLTGKKFSDRQEITDRPRLRKCLGLLKPKCFDPLCLSGKNIIGKFSPIRDNNNHKK